jgi:hypothetical protein
MTKFNINMKTCLKQILLVSILLSQFSLGQTELNLFQETADSQQRTETASRRPERASQRESEPAFTLVGTSRFGDEYFASLLARNGDSVKADWKKGTVAEIEGYRGYSIASIGSRKVSIRMPDSESCIENESKGVRCNGNIALLSLSYSEPLEPVENIENSNVIIDSDENIDDSEIVTDDESSQTIGNSRVLRRNPFSGELQELPDLTPEEQAAREERQQERAERFRNFEIVRIPDNEIPEGMQRVRTPFGDSLEPED